LQQKTPSDKPCSMGFVERIFLGWIELWQRPFVHSKEFSGMFSFIQPKPAEQLSGQLIFPDCIQRNAVEATTE